ncbi:MAG: cobaltochelatase subunit CobN, partial [Snowella sp.]
QTSAPIVILTAADTDIQTLAASLAKLPPEFPAIRVANLLQLQKQLSIDRYADTVLSQAQVIVLRLLGGRSYWSYGLEIVREIAEETGASLFILPGDDRPDPEAIAHSTVPLTAVNRLWRYWIEGGRENIVNALKFITDTCLGTNYYPLPPQEVPRIGLYSWQNSAGNYPASVVIIFYRAHYLAGNTLPIDALCQALVQNNLNPIPIFVSSLRDREIQEILLSYCQSNTENKVQLLLNTTSFSLAKLDNNIDIADSLYLWHKLDVPVLQVIFSSGTEAQWDSSLLGLSPRDIAMNVALPEVDGHIITRAISFKSVKTWNSALETDVVIYQPRLDRINWIADLAANWIHLKNTPIPKRKIALILANYPNRDSRIANGVGLDTPASCLAILKALKAAGYLVENIPETGDELIRELTASVTNDR